MKKGIIGKKIGMTQIFDEKGNVVPVTVIEATPNVVAQVKTVETGHYTEYDMTNNFYQAMGYKKLEVFPRLWDEWNPCQIYIKYLGS